MSSQFTIERVAHDYVRVYHSLGAEAILLGSAGARPGVEPWARRAPTARLEHTAKA